MKVLLKYWDGKEEQKEYKSISFFQYLGDKGKVSVDLLYSLLSLKEEEQLIGESQINKLVMLSSRELEQAIAFLEMCINNGIKAWEVKA